MTTLTEAKPRGRGRRQLILLALVFVVPLAGAWVLYSVFPDAARSLGTTNHGTFVHPARSVQLPVLPAPAGDGVDADFLLGKWTYVYVDRSRCESVCQRNLWKIRQVRLAQGEDTHRVQRLFVVTETEDMAGLKAALEHHPALAVVGGADAGVREFVDQFDVDGAAAAQAQRIYIVDPRGRLMMFYAPDADPKGMIEDMERLLKVSQIG